MKRDNYDLLSQIIVVVLSMILWLLGEYTAGLIGMLYVNYLGRPNK